VMARCTPSGQFRHACWNCDPDGERQVLIYGGELCTGLLTTHLDGSQECLMPYAEMECSGLTSPHVWRVSCKFWVVVCRCAAPSIAVRQTADHPDDFVTCMPEQESP
jgi:hypothetical protein